MSLSLKTTLILCAITQSCCTTCFSVGLDIKNVKLQEGHLQCIIAWSCLLRCRGAFMTNVFFPLFCLTSQLCPWQSKDWFLQAGVTTVPPPPTSFSFISMSFSPDKNGHDLVKRCTWKSMDTKKTTLSFFFCDFKCAAQLTLELLTRPSVPVKKDGTGRDKCWYQMVIHISLRATALSFRSFWLSCLTFLICHAAAMRECLKCTKCSQLLKAPVLLREASHYAFWTRQIDRFNHWVMQWSNVSARHHASAYSKENLQLRA